MSDTFDSKQIIENAHSEISKRKLSGEIPESEISLMSAYSIFKAESGSAQTSLAGAGKKTDEIVFDQHKRKHFFQENKKHKTTKKFLQAIFSSANKQAK